MRDMAAPRRPSHYSAGETVPVSGIYRVEHTRHRSPHEVIAIQGEVFPTCRRCLGRVAFTLARATTHMTHDMDLAGPQWDDLENDDEDGKNLAS